MIRIGDWISKAWEIFTKSVGVHIVLALIVGLGSLLTIGILAGPLACGWLYIILRQLREPDYKPEIGDIGKGFEVFGQAFVAHLLVAAALVVLWIVMFVLSFVPLVGSLLGFVVVLAGALLVSTVVLFVDLLIIDRRMEAVEAIKASIEKVKPEFWGFFGFAVLASVIAGAGIIGCGIGTLVTVPVATIAIAIAYQDNFEDLAAPAKPEIPAPPPAPPVEQ